MQILHKDTLNKSWLYFDTSILYEKYFLYFLKKEIYENLAGLYSLERPLAAQVNLGWPSAPILKMNCK